MIIFFALPEATIFQVRSKNTNKLLTSLQPCKLLLCCFKDFTHNRTLVSALFEDMRLQQGVNLLFHCCNYML